MAFEFGSGQTDVLVVGGGFAGLASGSVLAAAGLQVTVLDAGPAASFRGELLHPGGARALADLGLRPAMLSAGAVPVPGFAAYSGAGADAVLLPYPKEAGQGVALDHAELVGLLRKDFLSRRGAQLVSSRTDDVILENGRVVGVRQADGTELRARLVIAADGRHSRLRVRLGFPTRVTLLSYTLAPVLEGSLLPHPGYGHVFVGGPGPILAYPYGHDRVRMCIDVPTGIKGGRRGLVTFVRERCAEYVPEPLRSGMLDALERGEFEGSANHAISTERCVAPGIALVGDSGGCSHPVTATGLTTALHDVTTLAECLAEKGFSDDALETYQRRRYRYSRAREVFAQALYEVLRGTGAGARGLCDGMFEYWKSSERSRLASMAILAGEASSPRAFAAEYSRVMARSVYTSVRKHLVRGLPEELSDMFSTAKNCLGLAADRTWATMALEARRGTGAMAAPIVKLDTAASTRKASAADAAA